MHIVEWFSYKIIILGACCNLIQYTHHIVLRTRRCVINRKSKYFPYGFQKISFLIIIMFCNHCYFINTARRCYWILTGKRRRRFMQYNNRSIRFLYTYQDYNNNRQFGYYCCTAGWSLFVVVLNGFNVIIYLSGNVLFLL